jgi:GGDEF domain-containing protein
VFRVGGDEFAALLMDAGEGEREVAADRIREAIAAADPRITASWGTATWPGDGGSKDVLVAEADARLYAMKTGGERPPVA